MTRSNTNPRLIACTLLSPGPTAAITRTITTTTQRERALLVELLHAEYAHALSTNRMRWHHYRSRYGCNGTGPLPWVFFLFALGATSKSLQRLSDFAKNVCKMHTTQ